MAISRGPDLPQSRVRPVHLFAAAAILGLLVMQVALADAGDTSASKSASLVKQIKALKKRVADLEAKPDQVGQIPASLPPSGPAAGDLTGTYPDPSIDATTVQRRVSGSCATNAVTSVDQTGSVGCAASEGLHYVGATGEPQFQNGWGNYGGSFAKAAFYKDRGGVVHLRGLVTGGTYGDPRGVGEIFRLPSGYGPCGDAVGFSNLPDLLFATVSSNAIGRITIATETSAGPNVGAEVGSAWITLDGIDWRAEGC